MMGVISVWADVLLFILPHAFHFSKIFDLANLRMCAASNGDSKVIIALIGARANVNDINERGAPWLWACMQR